MADPKEGCCENKGDEDGEVGGSKRESNSCSRRCEIGIRSGGQEVQHEVLVLDSDVRPLASVSAIDEGIVVFGPQESYIENTSSGQRIPMNRRHGLFVMQLDAQPVSRATKILRFDKPNSNERTLVFRRPT